jgi:hypothetical protein
VKAYSAERKEAVLRQMMPAENKAMSALARETVAIDKRKRQSIGVCREL